jgi:hypothetical protein
MSGLGEGVHGSALPVIPIAPPIVLPPPVVHKALMAHHLLGRKAQAMDMHIDNMVRRHNIRANPDITPRILDKLVDGDVRSRSMAISQVYFNAAKRMDAWDTKRMIKYNKIQGANAIGFSDRMSIFLKRSHKYKTLFTMLSPNYDPPDRAVVEYIDTSADEM